MLDRDSAFPNPQHRTIGPTFSTTTTAPSDLRRDASTHISADYATSYASDRATVDATSRRGSIVFSDISSAHQHHDTVLPNTAPPDDYGGLVVPPPRGSSLNSRAALTGVAVEASPAAASAYSSSPLRLQILDTVQLTDGADRPVQIDGSDIVRSSIATSSLYTNSPGGSMLPPPYVAYD